MSEENKAMVFLLAIVAFVLCIVIAMVGENLTALLIGCLVLVGTPVTLMFVPPVEGKLARAIVRKARFVGDVLLLIGVFLIFIVLSVVDPNGLERTFERE